jgi:pSer/pThr/pTyr-binding forkhead associated (FHA) protein
MKAVLTVIGGRHRGQVLVLRSGDNVVGRSREADVLLEDWGVSRRHARFTVDVRGRVDVLDLGSTNGTFVNGERIASESLRVGDRIRMGLTAVLELGQRPNLEGLPNPEVGVPSSTRRRDPAGLLGAASPAPKASTSRDTPSGRGSHEP